MQDTPSKKEIGQRLKKLRLEQDLSQAEFASILALSRSNYSQIELGNQFPPYEVLIGVSKHYNKSYEWILHGTDMSSIISGTSVLYKKTESLGSKEDRDFSEPLQLAPQTVASSATSQMFLVENHQKQKYANCLRDSEYLKELPIISIPLSEFSDSYFRAFEVEGDVMKNTLLHNDIVISKFVPDMTNLDLSKIFIFVLRDSVVIRRVASYMKEIGLIICSTDNRKYKPITIQVQDIKEIWEVTAKFSTKVTRVIEDIGSHMDEFDNTLLELKQEIHRLKADPSQVIIPQRQK